MITKITLKNVASYGEDPVILETDKKINFIYGLNGTGKTIISKYLQNKDDANFCNCSVEGINNEKILVYNQKFIDDNTLQVAERVNSNAVVECNIVSLSDAPAIVSAGETVSTRRITIRVHVTYRDLVKRKTVYDKDFTNYGDYPGGGAINDRRNAIEEAIDKITEDILLDTVSGW